MSSTFRYAQCKPSKDVYKELQVGTNGTALGLSASLAHVAVPWGVGSNGSVALLPTDPAKFVRNTSPKLIRAHGPAVTDLAWSPHDPLKLATCSGDGCVKLWSVPADGLSEDLKQAEATVAGFKGGLHAMSFHRSAAGVLAVGGKNTASVVDLAQQKSVLDFAISGWSKDVIDVDWSFDGSMLAAAGKNQVMHLFDPRAAASDVLASGAVPVPGGNGRVRPSHVMFLGADNHLLVCGQDQFRKPLLTLLDPRKMDTPVLRESLNMSSGVMLPVYDADTHMLFLTMRGSSLLTAFDLTNRSTLRQTTQCAVKTGVLGLTLTHKAALDTDHSEVQRLFKLSDSTIQPISVMVPRKMAGFHEELYPLTPSFESSLTADAWLGGSNAEPKLVDILHFVRHPPIASSSSTSAAAAAAATTSSADDDDTKTKKPESTNSTESEQQKQQQQQQQQAGQEEEEKKTEQSTNEYERLVSANKAKSAVRSRIDSALAKSAFQHTMPTQPMSRTSHYFDVKPGNNLPLGRTLSCNDKFFAMPWKAIGGSGVLVHPLAKPGRIGAKAPLVRGHKSQVSCLELSKLHDTLLVSGGPSGHVRVTQVPEAGLTADLHDAVLDVVTSGKVTSVRWHPYAAQTFVSSSVGFSGASVRLWDVNTGQSPVHLANLHEEPVEDIAFNYDAGALMATSARDRLVRIIDPRVAAADCVVNSFQPVESVRDTTVMFTSRGQLLTLGFGPMSKRSVSLWDMKDLSKPLNTVQLDRDNSTMMSHFDDDTGLLYVGSSGAGAIRLFQVTKANRVEFIRMWSGSELLSGMAFLSKRACNVRNVEIAKFLKLTQDTVIPVTVTVPRKRKEFFQDDLFPPTLSVDKPVFASVDDFVQAGSKHVDLPRVSLQPDGMTPLSEAPAEELTTAQKKYVNRIKEAEKPKPKNFMGHTRDEEVVDHFRAAVATMPVSNIWDARQESGDDISDSEWD
eukprot:TRINITY_DN65800_c7_g8_i1.p1 TRINITY_DN65800_c7_g8~~TRINITY_DN65800_c7_g8_i1.p1  ORF type:complete len:961 (+),score=510.52 TRINITY_DN65800_c7_g8_i1:53-2935(+)